MVVVHDVLAHCDGLVLVATRHHGVHLFNPVAVRLPWSPSSVAPRHATGRLPAYGLGRDARSGSYKVTRFFYREVYVVATRTLGITTGMEVFTVGDDHWQEAAAQPTHPVLPERTVTFFHTNSYLLWTIQSQQAEEGEGILRFSLENETTFGFTPPPPYRASTRPVDYASTCITSSLSELSGELCMARLVTTTPPNRHELELWMAKDGSNVTPSPSSNQG